MMIKLTVDETDDDFVQVSLRARTATAEKPGNSAVSVAAPAQYPRYHALSASGCNTTPSQDGGVGVNAEGQHSESASMTSQEAMILPLRIARMEQVMSATSKKVGKTCQVNSTLAATARRCPQMATMFP